MGGTITHAVKQQRGAPPTALGNITQSPCTAKRRGTGASTSIWAATWPKPGCPCLPTNAGMLPGPPFLPVTSTPRQWGSTPCTTAHSTRCGQQAGAVERSRVVPGRVGLHAAWAATARATRHQELLALYLADAHARGRHPERPRILASVPAGRWHLVSCWVRPVKQ